MIKMNLQLFAHKKGMGSTKNGRDSESKRLGAKKGDGQAVIAGNILVRQRQDAYASKVCSLCSVSTYPYKISLGTYHIYVRIIVIQLTFKLAS